MPKKKGQHFKTLDDYGQCTRRVQIFGHEIFFGDGRWWIDKPHGHWHETDGPFEVLDYVTVIEFNLVNLLADGKASEIDTIVINATVALHLWANGKITAKRLNTAEEDETGIRLRLPFAARQRKFVINADDAVPEAAAIFNRRGEKVQYIPYGIVFENDFGPA